MKFKLLHPIGYETNPRSGPDDFKAIEDGLRRAGHELVDHPESIEVLLFDSGVWNRNDGSITPYDGAVLESVLRRRVPVVWFDAFDRSPAETPWNWSESLTNVTRLVAGRTEPDIVNGEDWNRFAWAIIKQHHPVMMFMRKMQKNREYTPLVLPLEYPIWLDFPLDSREQYLARPLDVCGIANLSYPRAHAFIGLLRALGSKADCEVRPHYRRIEQNDFIARHRQARFFVEADTSMGSERPMILSTVSAMLRITSPHRIPFERTDLVHQVEIGDHDGWIRDEDVAKLKRVLADGDLCYNIYVQGAEFMRRHYSLQARTAYVIENIERWLKCI